MTLKSFRAWLVPIAGRILTGRLCQKRSRSESGAYIIVPLGERDLP